jgi:hypothetical protein
LLVIQPRTSNCRIFFLSPEPCGLGNSNIAISTLGVSCIVVEHDVAAHRGDPGWQADAEAPAGDVHLVDPLVAHVAVAVVPVPVPVVVEAVAVERAFLGRPLARNRFAR